MCGHSRGERTWECMLAIKINRPGRGRWEDKYPGTAGTTGYRFVSVLPKYMSLYQTGRSYSNVGRQSGFEGFVFNLQTHIP